MNVVTCTLDHCSICSQDTHMVVTHTIWLGHEMSCTICGNRWFVDRPTDYSIRVKMVDAFTPDAQTAAIERAMTAWKVGLALTTSNGVLARSHVG